MELKVNGVTTKPFFNKYNKKEKIERYKIIDIKPFYTLREVDKDGISTTRYFSTMPDIAEYLNVNIPAIQRHLMGSSVKKFIESKTELTKELRPYVVEIDGVIEEHKCISDISKKLGISVSNFHGKIKDFIINKN